MAKGNSFLAVDFGAGSLKVAEFVVDVSGALVLQQYSIKPLGLEGSQEAKREALILKSLQEIIAELGIKAKDINVCAPGFHVFSKFVKLPPVDPGKVTQIKVNCTTTSSPAWPGGRRSHHEKPPTSRSFWRSKRTLAPPTQASL